VTQNWAETNFLSPYGNQGGGGDVPEPWWRDNLDFRRSMWRQTPEASYPDGYLATIRSRRDDRLLDSLKNRLTQRSYQRGVHKGERIDPGDYLWPGAWRPERGLQAESVGVKQTLAGIIPERGQVGPEQMLPRGTGSLSTIRGFNGIVIDPKRVDQLRKNAPPWR
jgi:hypothetical protein